MYITANDPEYGYAGVTKRYPISGFAEDPQPFIINLFYGDEVCRVGEPYTIRYKLTGMDSEYWNGSVTVDECYDGVAHTFNYEISTVDVEAGEYTMPMHPTEGWIRFTPAHEGNISVFMSAFGPEGRYNSNDLNLPIVAAGASTDILPYKLSLDKDVYQVGDKARVTVNILKPLPEHAT